MHANNRVLEPRGASKEEHPLIVRDAYCLSELQYVLLEKDWEVAQRQREETILKAVAVSNGHQDPHQQHQQTQQTVISDQPKLYKPPLFPRNWQYEPNALMEPRGCDGLTPIERYLQGQDQVQNKQRQSAAAKRHAFSAKDRNKSKSISRTNSKQDTVADASDENKATTSTSNEHVGDHTQNENDGKKCHVTVVHNKTTCILS